MPSDPVADIRISAVQVGDDDLTVTLMDGRTITMPLAWSPRLLAGTPGQRAHWKLIGAGYGIHWPELDEDISTKGLLAGAAPHGSANGPPKPDPMRADLKIIGPFQSYRVAIGGYEVPHVEAHEVEHGTKLSISVDHRFTGEVPVEYGQTVLWLMANAMAVAAGYSSHGGHSRRPNPFRVGMHGIGPDDDG